MTTSLAALIGMAIGLIAGIALGMTLGRDYLDGLMWWNKPARREPKFTRVLLPNQGRVIDVDWRELDKPTCRRNA